MLIFKQGKTSPYSKFSFSLTANKPSWPYHLPITGGKTDGFMPLPRAFAQSET